MVYDRMRTNFQKWSTEQAVAERELYAFLHMLKGTAGSVGLKDLTNIATIKIENLQEKGAKQWSKDEWTAFLNPLIEALLFFEENKPQEIIEKITPIQTTSNTKKDFILIVDDDMVFISYIKNALEKKGFQIVIAHNGKKGLELIYELQPAIVFLDLMLPDIDGFSILNNIKKIKKDRTFIAIMSSHQSKENRIKAYELGALDFISKPVDEDILIAFIANRLTYRKELEYAIVIDELTQVYNRKYFDGQLNAMLQQFETSDETFAVAIVDLDFFKKVNDTYGHLIGDEVLKGFAALVMRLKREQDTFCRYGGEEFILLMPQTSVQEAYILLEHIRQEMSKTLFSANGENFAVTFSAGVTAVREQYKHAKKLLEAADQALYAAKTAGRNRTLIFDKSITTVSKMKKLKVIIIDDVYIIREMIVTHFEQLAIQSKNNMEVEAFSSGQQFIQSNWYDPNYRYIILLDWMMPNMSGLDVLKEIRAHYTPKEVIVSMLTGQTGEEFVLEAFKNGADDFIRKPFQIAEVSARILHLAERMFQGSKPL